MNAAIPAKNIDLYLGKAIDFHCHGIGRFDFTEILQLDLFQIERILKERHQHCILTMYLPKQNFEDFLNLMEHFHLGKQRGEFTHIKGIGLEGPLLASHGGTPEIGVWMPSKSHWQALANCGSKGLIYIILSPDAQLHGSNFPFDPDYPSITWITETLLTGGVLPAPGHFTKSDPVTSAQSLQLMFDVVSAWGHGATVTDHLYNDMPHNFKHAWRTPREKAQREQEIQMLDLENWNLNSLEDQLGIVPAVIIKNARKGLVKVCQNFDGEHVDLEIVKKTVELLGAENMLMMTDSIENHCLAGRKLQMHDGSSLLYQDEGIVAAGSQGIDRQIQNMVLMELSDQQIQFITQKVASDLLIQQEKYIEQLTYAEVSRL